jgi:hypothetical protein
MMAELGVMPLGCLKIAINVVQSVKGNKPNGLGLKVYLLKKVIIAHSLLK